MKTLILLIISIVFLKLNFFAQEKPKSKKEISFGIVPYEPLLKSGIMLLAEGERFSYGFAASYVLDTRIDIDAKYSKGIVFDNNSHYTKSLDDKTNYEGVTISFLGGFGVDKKPYHHYFSVGAHYLYYDHYFEDGGYQSYSDALKAGGHFSYVFMHKLSKNGKLRFFLKSTIYISYFEKINKNSGLGVLYSLLSPQDIANLPKPHLMSGVLVEPGISLGLFLNVKFRDNSKKAVRNN